jgi:hypothetical protein
VELAGGDADAAALGLVAEPEPGLLRTELMVHPLVIAGPADHPTWLVAPPDQPSRGIMDALASLA